MFNHEKFEAYKLSTNFLVIAFKLANNIPRGYSAVKDQFIRASVSIPLNIAEGSGKSSTVDKQRFYSIAGVRCYM